MPKHKKLKIYCDGGSRGNPGAAAIGVVIKDAQDKLVKTYSEFLGDDMTNNQAEYSAVIFALGKVKLFGAKGGEIEFYLDSELAVNQLGQKFKIKDKNLGSLFIKVWNLTLDFKSVKYFHVSREQNKQADRLVNEALDNRG